MRLKKLTFFYLMYINFWFQLYYKEKNTKIKKINTFIYFDLAKCLFSFFHFRWIPVTWILNTWLYKVPNKNSCKWCNPKFPRIHENKIETMSVVSNLISFVWRCGWYRPTTCQNLSSEKEGVSIFFSPGGRLTIYFTEGVHNRNNSA